jgi:SOS-response transcriptional repressor LexA
MAKTKVAPNPNVGRNIGALMEASVSLPSQPALAKRTGVAQSTIGRILRGEVNPAAETLHKIADAYDVNVDALYLAPAAFLEAMRSGNLRGHAAAGNVTEVEPRRRVPLISWVQAGDFEDVHDWLQPGEALDWVDVYDTVPSDPSFALRVNGDSMTSPHSGELSFPEGTIIVVDPTRGGDAGDYVVAKDVLTQKATFKRLTTDGARWFLKPLNPAYPTIEIDDPALRVIGRVIEYQVRGKL